MKNRIKLNAMLVGLLFTDLIPFIMVISEISFTTHLEHRIEWLTKSVTLLGYASYILGIYLTMYLAKENRILNAVLVVVIGMITTFGTYAVIANEINESPTVTQLILTWGTLSHIAVIPIIYILISKSGHRKIITSR